MLGDTLTGYDRRSNGDKVLRCWPSEYVALPDLDAETSAIAIERITLRVVDVDDGAVLGSAVVALAHPLLGFMGLPENAEDVLVDMRVGHQHSADPQAT